MKTSPQIMPLPPPGVYPSTTEENLVTNPLSVVAQIHTEKIKLVPCPLLGWEVVSQTLNVLKRLKFPIGNQYL